MAEKKSPYEEAAARLKDAGGHYADYDDLVEKSFNNPVPQSDFDANLIPAGIGATLGIPVSLYQALKSSPIPTSSIADIARTVAAETAPTAFSATSTAAGVTPKATGRGAAVINYANQVNPAITNLEAIRAGNYEQVAVAGKKAAALAEQTKGFLPGENLMLPREIQEQQAARQIVEARRAAELAAKPSTSQVIRNIVGGAGDILAKSKVMPILGGAASGYDIASAIDEYNQGEYGNAAISGLSGLGGLAMMSRTPTQIGIGALMQAPALARAGYRYLTKPKE